MARKKGMTGPGALAMGGMGAKPMRPPTAAAGRPSPVKPPGASPLAGAPGPMPGAGGPPGGGGGPPKMGGGGIGGAPGFKKGGEAHKVETKREEEKEEHAFKKGGQVRYEKGGEVKGRVGRDTAHASKSG